MGTKSGGFAALCGELFQNKQIIQMGQDREQKINWFILPSTLYITPCMWPATKLSLLSVS